MKKYIPNTFLSRRFKPSKYNIVASYRDKGMILYNSLTGNRVLLRSDVINDGQLAALQDEKPISVTDFSSREVFDFLFNNEFLIPIDRDELSSIQEWRKHHLDNPNLRRITIILTRKCNLGCTYCFQHKEIGDQPVNEQKVIRYIESQTIPDGSLQITWFGGEPTLRLKTICQLSDVAMEFCRLRKATYRATISTNAVLLDESKIDLLLSKKVQQFQISLDGPLTMQEARRPALNGASTYHTIVRNIDYLAKRGAEVVIKVIFDNENFQSIPYLFDDLKARNLLDNIKIAIQHTEGKNAAYDYNKRFQSLEEMSAKKIFLLRKLAEKGYKLPEPSRRAEFCAANSKYSTMIDMNGDMFRCSTERMNVTGVISDEGRANITNSDYDSLFVGREYAIDDCKTCKVLPICGGGCTSAAEGHNNREICSFYRTGIYDYLRLLEFQSGQHHEAPVIV